MSVIKVKSYAKINLALNVTGKLVKLHKIESIVAFINLHDLIFIKSIKGPSHQVSFHGNFSKNISRNNTVEKLFKILDENELLKDKKFQIRIKKNIPQKAGLGGGSMNAANILNTLIKKNFIKISQKTIHQISSLIGSDVILGVKHASAIIKSNNVVEKFSKCTKFYTLLVKPNFGCSTKEIYSRVNKITKSKFTNPKKSMFNSRYLLKQENALESVAF